MTDVEKALFAALDAAEAEIAPAMQAEDFGAAMSAMGWMTPISLLTCMIDTSCVSSRMALRRSSVCARPMNGGDSTAAVVVRKVRRYIMGLGVTPRHRVSRTALSRLRALGRATCPAPGLRQPV